MLILFSFLSIFTLKLNLFSIRADRIFFDKGQVIHRNRRKKEMQLKQLQNLYNTLQKVQYFQIIL